MDNLNSYLEYAVRQMVACANTLILAVPSIIIDFFGFQIQVIDTNTFCIVTQMTNFEVNRQRQQLVLELVNQSVGIKCHPWLPRERAGGLDVP